MTWTELEQTFFAAAPPDVAEAAPEPESFDDLDAETPLRRAADRFVGPLATQLFRRQVVTIAVATAFLLIALSTVVFASLH